MNRKKEVRRENYRKRRKMNRREQKHSVIVLLRWGQLSWLSIEVSIYGNYWIIPNEDAIY